MLGNRKCSVVDQTLSCSENREDTKKKKKKKKSTKKKSERVSASTTEFPKPVSLLPSLTPGGKKSRERIGGSSCRKKKLSETPPDLLTPTDGGAAAEGGQSRESLRWEGVLEDREAEERRLEVYRANRRRRYVAHREAEDGGGRRREGTGTDSGQSCFNTDQKELNFY